MGRGREGRDDPKLVLVRKILKFFYKEDFFGTQKILVCAYTVREYSGKRVSGSDRRDTTAALAAAASRVPQATTFFFLLSLVKISFASFRFLSQEGERGRMKCVADISRSCVRAAVRDRFTR